MKNFCGAFLSRIVGTLLVYGIFLIPYASGANARFISPDDWDPTKPGVGTNRYAYGLNDPINNSDPSGHVAGVDDLAVGGVAIGAIATFAAAYSISDLQDDGRLNGSVGRGMGDAIATGLQNLASCGLSSLGISLEGDVATKSEQRRFGDLEPIKGPAHSASRPELQDLSNEDLKDAIFNPQNGQGIKVREGENLVLDGNGRINEARARGLFSDDDMIPVDELPKKDDLAPWERDDNEASSSDKQSDKNSQNGRGGDGGEYDTKKQ